MAYLNMIGNTNLHIEYLPFHKKDPLFGDSILNGQGKEDHLQHDCKDFPLYLFESLMDTGDLSL